MKLFFAIAAVCVMLCFGGPPGVGVAEAGGKIVLKQCPDCGQYHVASARGSSFSPRQIQTTTVTTSSMHTSGLEVPASGGYVAVPFVFKYQPSAKYSRIGRVPVSTQYSYTSSYSSGASTNIPEFRSQSGGTAVGSGGPPK